MKTYIFSIVSILVLILFVLCCAKGLMFLAPILYIIMLWVQFGLHVTHKKCKATVFSKATLITINFVMIYTAVLYSALNYRMAIWIVVVMLSVEFFISGLEMIASSLKIALSGGLVRRIHWILYHLCAWIMLSCGFMRIGALSYLFISIITILVAAIYFIKYRKILLGGKVKNFPNMLTLLRIILVIPFIICFFIPTLVWVALIIFIVASITDFLDGYLARKHNLITNFGKIMDPLADKVLVMAALILFTTNGNFPMWAIIILLFREVYVTVIRIYAAQGGNVIAAGKSGKLKTVIQMITIVVLFIFPEGVLAWVFVTLTIILTVYSGGEYMIQNIGFLKSEGK